MGTSFFRFGTVLYHFIWRLVQFCTNFFRADPDAFSFFLARSWSLKFHFRIKKFLKKHQILFSTFRFSLAQTCAKAEKTVAQSCAKAVFLLAQTCAKTTFSCYHLNPRPCLVPHRKWGHVFLMLFLPISFSFEKKTKDEIQKANKFEKRKSESAQLYTTPILGWWLAGKKKKCRLRIWKK